MPEVYVHTYRCQAFEVFSSKQPKYGGSVDRTGRARGLGDFLSEFFGHGKLQQPPIQLRAQHHKPAAESSRDWDLSALGASPIRARCYAELCRGALDIKQCTGDSARTALLPGTFRRWLNSRHWARPLYQLLGGERQDLAFGEVLFRHCFLQRNGSHLTCDTLLGVRSE
ncbi:MAG: hypothetical protein DMG08_08245 [Acidobacteria bacterium]|nr:MAG: hypothetical protein DMG08_08245 [Acidobacteriota bacterium]